jgi:hypothetical protein
MQLLTVFEGPESVMCPELRLKVEMGLLLQKR